MSYSLVVVVAIIIHLLLNSEYFKEIEDKNGVNKAFRSYVWSALWYYVMDALWGIIYESHIQSLIYLISILYYISMAATVVFLCGYVTSYLKMKTGFGKFIKCFGIAFCAFEIGILAINHFYHIFFWVDPNGVYYAYGMRDVAFCMQVLLCVLLAIQTGTAIKKSTGEVKKRYFTIFLFCIEMTVAIIVQILYPLLPLYSIGLILGICIIHTFVNESEKEKQYNALLSIADIHYSMHEIVKITKAFSYM